VKHPEPAAPAAPAPAPAAVQAQAEALLAGLPHAAWLARLDTRAIVAANAEAEAWFGSGEAGSLVGRAADAVAASPEDLAWWLGADLGEHAALHSDTLVGRQDGQTRHASRSIRVVQLPWGPAGATLHLALVTLADRSAEVQTEALREELLEELQGTLEATADGILVTDLAGRVRVFNRRFAELFGLADAVLLKRDDIALREALVARLADPAADAARLLALQAEAGRPERFTLLVPERGQLQERVLERVARPLLQGGRGSGCVWSFRDQTEKLAAQQRIETLSCTDPLTGLANRGRLTEHVRSLLDLPVAEGGAASLSLLVVDLDRFGYINDTLGHAVGNELLLDVARRIQGCLRRGDLLARVGGDQFAIVVSPADAAFAARLAERVLTEVKKPCTVGDAPFTLTCSIGVALAPSHGRDADQLMRRAEQAMRAVKASGRASWRLHQVRTEVDWRSHMRLDHAMRQALVANRFRLNYQPQVCLQTGRITGAEALLRWRDPEMGEISPGRFIKVAEDSGFIVHIGDWVLRTAATQAALWQAQGRVLPVAVNVSALQFQQSQFVDRVAEIITLAGIPPALLELELTESILLHDEGGEVMARLQALARLGVAMSIDDFGTGYSSLAYLKRIPVAKLKIDRAFVMGLPHDEGNAAIVRAIVQMARALGKGVIAEGVETDEQRRFLQDCGCDEFQGFLFAPALDVLSFEARLPALDEPKPPKPAPRRAARMRLVSG
jgi:diguanylate cyclase (GGDEF)-like protein/PAS domain S-box-containing protein